MRTQLSQFYCSIISAQDYVDEKMASLAKKVDRGESLDDGTFMAFLMMQNKLTRDEIYSVVAEIMAGSVDTVNTYIQLVSMITNKGQLYWSNQ